MTPEQQNAVDIAVVKNELTHVKEAMLALIRVNEAQSKKIDALTQIMAEARGSWRAIVMFGAGAGAIGGGIVTLLQYLKGVS